MDDFKKSSISNRQIRFIGRAPLFITQNREGLKMNRIGIISSTLTSLFLGAVSPSEAGITYYFAEDISPGSFGAAANSQAERARFEADIGTVLLENLEDETVGYGKDLDPNIAGSIWELEFVGAGEPITAGLESPAETEILGTSSGAFPASGSNYYRSSSQFSITFSERISAFGFYGHDIGDFGGELTIILIGDVIELRGVPHTVNLEEFPYNQNSSNESVIFWGFQSDMFEFDEIKFVNSSEDEILFDLFEFDDFLVGIRGGNVPEPGSTSLIVLAVASLVRRGRR